MWQGHTRPPRSGPALPIYIPCTLAGRRSPGGSVIKLPLLAGGVRVLAGLGAQAHRPCFSHPGSCSGVADPAVHRPLSCATHCTLTHWPHPYTLFRCPPPPFVILHVSYPHPFLLSRPSSFGRLVISARLALALPSYPSFRPTPPTRPPVFPVPRNSVARRVHRGVSSSVAAWSAVAVAAVVVFIVALCQ